MDTGDLAHAAHARTVEEGKRPRPANGRSSSATHSTLMRIRFTLDISRSSKTEPDPVPIFEHRDTDTMVEPTYGGDPRAHRMGFLPSPRGDEQED